MPNQYEELVRYVADKGQMSDEDARRSVAACRNRMLAEGAFGYAAGALAGIFLTGGVGAIPLAIGGTAAGASHALLKSASCSDVRGAAEHWLAMED